MDAFDRKLKALPAKLWAITGGQWKKAGSNCFVWEHDGRRLMIVVRGVLGADGRTNFNWSLAIDEVSAVSAGSFAEVKRVLRREVGRGVDRMNYELGFRF